MNYQILVNKDHQLSKTYIPLNLVLANSQYKKDILINKRVYKAFRIMQKAAYQHGYKIDIMSGYRTYEYQDNLYNKSLQEKGYADTFRSIAKPGCSEHQTGLAIDICIYHDGKCYIEHEIENTAELSWLKNNCAQYGFILRYPKEKEDITGYNYEPWHYRYVGQIAQNITKNNLTFEEYLAKNNDCPML